MFIFSGVVDSSGGGGWGGGGECVVRQEKQPISAEQVNSFEPTLEESPTTRIDSY